MNTKDYIDIVETSKSLVSEEQLERTFHRYMLAQNMSENKEVLDVGCGTGIGLEIIYKSAKNVTAGDLSLDILQMAKQKNSKKINFVSFKAESLPFDKDSFDLIIFFEAIYYLKDAGKFFEESRKVLKPQGKVLFSTANNRLYDFTPSKYSTNYYNIPELQSIILDNGFSKVNFFGYHKVSKSSFRQKLLRPLKALASKTNLIPGSMKGKERLKQIFFGNLTEMPNKLDESLMEFTNPEKLSSLKEALEGEDIAAISSATEALMTASQEFGQRLYEAAAAQQSASENPSEDSDDGVVDAEIVDEQ